ncbi:MAG: hypothetical protein ACFE78_01550 [Candidatus Hodarchaeota archaeon]
MYEFKEYGKNMQTVAICTILSISFMPITPIISLIFMFIALGNIKKANLQLNNRNLVAYRSKYISSFIFLSVGITILAIGIAIIVLNALEILLFFDWMIIIAGATIILIGFVLMIVSGVIQRHAWENLKIFLAENGDLFPKAIAMEAYDGANKLKTAMLMYLLGFLGITLIIGFIFQIIGYFKLAKFNRLDISYSPKSEPQQFKPQQPYQEPVSIIKENPKFCSACGGNLSGEGRFCALCGTEVT